MKQAKFALIILVLVVCILLSHRSFVCVLSGSMEPSINKGSLIINRPIKKDLQAGDIITYKATINGKQVFITHRIMSIVNENGQTLFRTKGDNTPFDKHFVKHEDIVGVYSGLSITGLGFVFGFLSHIIGMITMLIAFGLVLLAFRLLRQKNAII
jgi:signal peptidase